MALEKFDQLSEKIDLLIDRLEELRRENRLLKEDKFSLERELQRAQDQLKKVEIKAADRAQTVKSKLSGVLTRLNELEQVGQ